MKSVNWYAKVIDALESISMIRHSDQVRRILVEAAKKHPKLIAELYKKEFELRVDKTPQPRTNHEH